jgi:hypothetical protein
MNFLRYRPANLQLAKLGDLPWPFLGVCFAIASIRTLLFLFFITVKA